MRAGEHIAAIARANVHPFRTVAETRPAGIWLRFPPVVEENEAGQLLIIDGTHRIFAASNMGYETVYAVIIGYSTATPPPPISPCDWRDLRVISQRRPRMPGHAPDLRRPTAKHLDRISGPYPSIFDAIQVISQ